MSGDPRSVEAQVAGEFAQVPAGLLLAGTGDAVRLYALLRCLGSDRSTYRKKDALAKALGWGRKRVFRAAQELEGLGWLSRKDARRHGRWVSVWTALDRRASPQNGHQSRNRPPVPETATGVDSGHATSVDFDHDTSVDFGHKDTTSISPSPRTNPPTPQGGDQVGLSPPQRGTRAEGSNPRARGTSPRAAKRALGAAAIEERLDAAWSSLSTFDRGQALEGHERLRAAVAELLAKPLPKRVTEAGLVLAWLERATAGTSLAGLRGPAGWLVKAARKRDPAADARAYAERLEAGRRKRAGPAPEPEPDPADLEPVDLDLLRRVSDSTRTA